MAPKKPNTGTKKEATNVKHGAVKGTASSSKPPPRRPKTRGGHISSAVPPRRSSTRLSTILSRSRGKPVSTTPIEVSPSSSPAHSQSNIPTETPPSSPPFCPSPSPQRFSPPPSPPPPPSDPSIVANRLKELKKGGLKIYFERGFLMNESFAPNRDAYVTPIVKAWGWDSFVEHNVFDVPIQMIHDFVANFPEGDRPTQVLVKGVSVDITPCRIRELFGFTHEPTEFDWYTHNLHNRHIPITHRKIAKTLCGDKFAQWDTGKIYTRHLTKQCQIWAKFVRSKLIPSQHCNKLTIPVAVATYNICSELAFHPQNLLYDTLCANSKHTQGPFYLPCLVKLLCDAAGVPPYPQKSAMVPKPLGPFDEACLKRICTQAGRGRRKTSLPSAKIDDPLPAKGKLSSLEEKVQGQEVLIQGLIKYIHESRPAILAAFKENFPKEVFPPIPAELTKAYCQAEPSSSRANDDDDDELESEEELSDESDSLF